LVRTCRIDSVDLLSSVFVLKTDDILNVCDSQTLVL
jgi:hypothetical protein